MLPAMPIFLVLWWVEKPEGQTANAVINDFDALYPSAVNAFCLVKHGSQLLLQSYV
jgi:hypothetical protein